MIIEDQLVTTVPKSAFYFPNFISALEEKDLMQNVYSVPKPKWTQLKNRRLQNWGGIPHAKGMIRERIPEWLQKYIHRINSYNIFDKQFLPNHVLINEYNPGQGIMPHVDGPLFHPIITTINCGSHTVLQFHPHCAKRVDHKNFSLLLEPRSLLILRDELYRDFLHGIDEVSEDVIDGSIFNLDHCENTYTAGQRLKRTARLSLTIRHVPRSSNFQLVL